MRAFISLLAVAATLVAAQEAQGPNDCAFGVLQRSPHAAHCGHNDLSCLCHHDVRHGLLDQIRQECGDEQRHRAHNVAKHACGLEDDDHHGDDEEGNGLGRRAFAPAPASSSSAMMMGTQASATPSAAAREGTQEGCTCAGTTNSNNNNVNSPAEPASSSQAVPVAHGPVASPFVGSSGGSAASSSAMMAHGSMMATPSPSSSSVPKGASPINHGTNQQASGAAVPSGDVFSPFKGAASSSYSLSGVLVSGVMAAVVAVLAL